MTDFPAPPVQAIPVVQSINPNATEPDLTKNVHTREWELHWQNITQQFNDNASTLDEHEATIDDHEDRITVLEATAAELEAKLDAYFHIGFIFETVKADNPSTYLGFGTWALYGVGRVTICLDNTDTDFDTVEETGGSKTVDWSHTHDLSAHTHDMNDHTHAIDHTHGAGTDIASGGNLSASFTGSSGVPSPTDTLGPSTDATSSGGSATEDIMNPYIVVYRWRRTA